jgi:hypothetical protein
MPRRFSGLLHLGAAHLQAAHGQRVSIMVATFLSPNISCTKQKQLHDRIRRAGEPRRRSSSVQPQLQGRDAHITQGPAAF